ncbi:MAG: protein kinase [Vicinamibacteria bacterium]|nr:protein kinase [Vicinamibacteria bacterium]MBP9946156.1 protein kinase [Vicinamibacteria bacterium]
MSEPALKEITGRIGKYDIIKPLGKGAMGIVYLAKDSMLDREVALKVMVSNIADDPELKMRFEREAKAVAKLSHPNVVNVFDLGYHTDGSPYMAMELLRGDDLQKTLRLGPMPLERKVSIIVQVLVGLAHAHQAGIVHRDIKPANIFIGNDGAVKIMDFGVARLTTASVTGTGAIVGTADYMSPEQVKGARVDGRSDLFSVGCMFYEMLVGKRPFHAENLMAIFFKITHDDPNWNAIPPGPEYDALTPILSKALAKDLGQRYENATQFALALRDYLATYGTSASAANRAIDDLVDLNAPTGTPAPLEDLLDDHDTDGTVDLSRGQAATRVGAAATMATGSSATLAGATRVGATRVGAPTQAGGTRAGATRVQAPARPQPAPAPEPKSNTTVIAAGFVFLIVTVGGGLYFIANKLDSNKAETQVAATPTPAAAPTTAAAATPTPAAVATAAPAPKFEAEGKSAGTVRAASEAFGRGDYDRAIQKAQEALREDPASTAGQKILDQARNGKDARARLAAARTALSAKDFPRARQIAQEASAKAPWDSQVTEVLNEISKAEAAEQTLAASAAQAKALQEKQATETAINALLAKAATALGSDKFDEAIALYDEVIKLDAGNGPAQSGKIGAMTARRAATAATSAGAPASGGKSFTAGRTDKKAGGPSGLGAAGFGDAGGVKSGTQAADMPGSVSFELQPKSPRPGDPYKILVKFTNEGSAPISLKGLTVRLNINGKGVGAAQPLAVSSVAPGDTAIVYSAGEVWSESITDWAYTATVTGSKGETYRNTISWK